MQTYNIGPFGCSLTNNLGYLRRRHTHTHTQNIYLRVRYWINENAEKLAPVNIERRDMCNVADGQKPGEFKRFTFLFFNTLSVRKQHERVEARWIKGGKGRMVTVYLAKN